MRQYSFIDRSAVRPPTRQDDLGVLDGDRGELFAEIAPAAESHGGTIR
ncbi:MAG: hypothetical protein ACOX6T_08410 [Myxococcales bacterium]